MEKNKPDFEKLAMDFSKLYWNNDRSTYENQKSFLDQFWTDYVTPLQSQLSEAEKRIKDHEIAFNSASEAYMFIIDDLQSQNERLLSALKELTEMTLDYFGSRLREDVITMPSLNDLAIKAANVKELINSLEKQPS